MAGWWEEGWADRTNQGRCGIARLLRSGWRSSFNLGSTMILRDKTAIFLATFCLVNLLITAPFQLKKINCAVPGNGYQFVDGSAVANHSAVGLSGYRFAVYFDQSYEQVYSPFNTSFTGMSEFAKFIIRQGGFVSSNSEPLRDFLPAISQPGNVIVLGVAMLQRYSDDDIEAI